jgi:hypothetical protein
MKWLKRVLIAIGLLLAMAVALPFFISPNDFIPEIEHAASDSFKQPVTINSVSFAALPVPHVTIEGIRVGSAGDIRPGKVRVIPELLSLLQPVWVFKSVEIESLALRHDGLDRILAWSRSNPVKPLRIKVENILIDQLLLYSGESSLGPFEARIRVGSNGVAGNASISSHDGKFRMLIQPEQANYMINASAKAWTPPFGPPVVFDELNVKGTATLDEAHLSQVSARLYGGTANGSAVLRWRTGWKLDGRLGVNQVAMQKASSMLSARTYVSGRLTASPAFSASAASADRLMNALRWEAPFSVQNGVLHGVDIHKAASSLVRQTGRGEQTRFDQLSGHVVMAHGSYRFTQLRIASGTLAVEGDVNVSPEKALSGRITAHIRAIGAVTGVPLNVAGTVDAPLLHLTGGTVMGAAVGTAILGPGVGTSVGAKIGGWIGGLFRARDNGTAEK